MAEEVEALLVTLNASIKDYEKNLAKALNMTTSQMRKIEKAAQDGMGRVESAFAKFGKGFLAGLGIGSATAALATFKQLVGQVAKVGDVADRVGATAEEIQKLNHAAVQANMGFEDFSAGLIKFSKGLGEAANGSGDLLKTFRLNGVELRNADGSMRPFLELLMDYADLVKNAGSESDQTLLSLQAFGRGGQDFIEFLKNGSAGLREMGDEAVTMKNELVKQAQVIDDQWAALMDNMSNGFKGMVLQNVANFQSMINSLNDPNAKSALRQIMENLGIAGNLFEPAIPKPQPAPVSNVGAKGNLQPTTKVFNAEADAEAKKKAAEAERELAKATRERMRAQEEADDEAIRNAEQFDQNFTNIEEQIQDLNLQAETMGKTTAEIERARIAQELYNAAQENGIPITEELTAQIEGAAQRYGQAAQNLEDVSKAQESLKEMNQLAIDSVMGFSDAIMAGTKPVDALKAAVDDLLRSLTKLLLNKALTMLLNPESGGGGGLAGLFQFKRGGIMSGAGPLPVQSYRRGGIKQTPQVSIHGDASVPEAVVPLPGGRAIPVKFKDAPGTSGNGDTKIVINNNNGSRVTTRTSRDDRGNQQVDFNIDSGVASLVNDPNSQTNKALGLRGARQPNTARAL